MKPIQTRTLASDAGECTLQGIAEIVQSGTNDLLGSIADEGLEAVSVQVVPVTARYTTSGSAEYGDAHSDYANADNGFLIVATVR